MARSLTIVVRGTPAPQGSKKFVGRAKSGRGILVESSAKVRPWRQDVRAAALEARGESAPLDGPVRCTMTFTLPKPGSAPKRRRSWPCRKPDASKLARSTEDALVEAGALVDDARIVELVVRKVFPLEGDDALDSPGAVIRLAEIDDGSSP